MRRFIAPLCEVQSPKVVEYQQKVIITASLTHVIGDGVVRAGLARGVIVAPTEPPTIALLRRLTVLDGPGERSSHSVPTPRGGGAPIALGLLAPLALAVAAVVAAVWLVGFVNAFNFMDGVNGISGAHALPGVVSLLGGTAVRVSADLAGLWVLAVYLGSPGLFARAGLRGVESIADRVGRAEAISEMEEA